MTRRLDTAVKAAMTGAGSIGFLLHAALTAAVIWGVIELVAWLTSI
ncbi:hypothetical protein [Streptomyces sp. CC53]|nr:hypothetical protein [Streptomyces sp. CC53]